MKCLVSGAAGFIGSHLCERLVADNHYVIGIDDLSSGKKENLSFLSKTRMFEFVEDSIGNQYSYGMYNPDWIFHLAGKADVVPSIEKPRAYHDANVTGTFAMLQYAKEINAKRFIYAASSSCYGIPNRYPTMEWDECDPRYPYALTKYIGEQYVLHWNRVYGIPAISLRLFNVYGPRSRTSGAYGAVFGTFLTQLANEEALTVVGDGSQSRDFTYVTDVVDAFVKAAESDKTGIFNVGTGKAESVNRLVELLGRPKTVNIPRRPGEPSMTKAGITKARVELGWEPKVPFEEGVAKMKELVDNYKDAPLWTPEKIEKETKSWFKYLS